MTSIGNEAFSFCQNLSSITIPNSVVSVCNLAFYDCSGLESVTVEWETPLDISSSDVFSRVDVANVKLYVPEGTAEAYRAAAVWQDFIIEEVSSITSATVDDSPVISTRYYDLQGRETAYPQQGYVYIVKDLHQSGKVSVERIMVRD